MAIDRVKVKKEADKFLTSGKVERAIDEFQKLIEDNPKDYNTLNQIGDLCVQVGRVKEGVEIHKRLGSAYERDGFHARAAAIFQKVVRNAPDDIDAAQRLADLYRQMNRPSDSVRVHLQVAEHFQKQGLIKRALDEFNKVVDLDPKNLKMKVKLADLYNKEGMKDHAATIYLEVAESLAMEQMHEDAAQILERAKAMISTPQVFLTQNRLSVIQGDFAAASAHLREGLLSNPRNPELLEALAEIEIRNGHPDRALEALADVAQLPEKSLHLCEKALRNLAHANRSEEGVRLFTPIARELARRGSGETVGRTLRSALHGNIGKEGWILLAEIAHQNGNRADQVAALQSAYGLACQDGDQDLIGRLGGQLQAIGVVPSLSSVHSQPTTFAEATPSTPHEATRHDGETEVDPLRRLRIDQLSREAEALVRGGSPERAIETYKKALEINPADLSLIEAIVAVHRSTGRLTQIQLQYVQSAQALVQLDKKPEALHLMDLAEQMFPGSTRIHRRTLGLPDPGAVPPPPPAAPVPDYAPPAAPPAVPAWENPISLTVPGLGVSAPGSEPIALGSGFPTQADPASPPSIPSTPSPQPADQETAEIDWVDLTLQDLPAPPSTEVAPTRELEPIPTERLSPEMFEALGPMPGQALPPTGDGPVPIPEELEGQLGDIDFQLDYGSPEEAKIEIEAALQLFPEHPELTSRLEQAQAALEKLGLSAKAAEAHDFTSSFFDLTDVLGTALMDAGEGEEKHDATHVVEKIQSVDELFSAFRDGVEKQVKGDDYDTHYNLGIAYKEMMLIDPAIEEFKVAMGDPERTLECCSMLSICEQARGDLDAAVAWLQQGVTAPGFPPEDSIGLRYDLAELYLQQGHGELATEAFRTVHSLDPDYRDVSARLA